MLKAHRTFRFSSFLLAAIAVCCVSPVNAFDTVWNGSADTNFLNDANWSNAAPTTTEAYGVLDSTDVNHVAIIDASAGSVSLKGIILGEFVGGANVIQNGGTLNFVPTAETKIGGEGAHPSNWVMNNDAVILYDGPLNGGGAGYGSDGVNGADFDIGNGASLATFELHDSAILRIADDLKISDNGTPAGGHVRLDGNSQITVGSGTAMGADGPGSLTIAGNSLYISGNSAGPGNTAQGYTNEGYFTANQGEVLVKDNGRFWIRTLQTRGGDTMITVQDNASFEIFDVFHHSSPVLGTSTVTGSVNGSERTSEVAEGPGSKMTLTIMDQGVMTVDSDIPDSQWSGLALSGGSNRGENGGGGETLVEVQGEGSFTVRQDLHMTMGTDAAATSTLKVRGPEATVAIHGDLRMGLDPAGVENPGSAVLHSVITAATHATIEVGGDFNIDNGQLVVELDGFSPLGGESYELIRAGSIAGTAFAGEDFTLAPLLDELSWELALNGTSVWLNVLGSVGIPGDYNNSGKVEQGDLDLVLLNWGATWPPEISGWVNDRPSDGVIDQDDLDGVLLGWGSTSASARAVPEPTSAMLVLAGLGMFCLRRSRGVRGDRPPRGPIQKRVT